MTNFEQKDRFNIGLFCSYSYCYCNNLAFYYYVCLVGKKNKQYWQKYNYVKKEEAIIIAAQKQHRTEIVN